MRAVHKKVLALAIAASTAASFAGAASSAADTLPAKAGDTLHTIGANAVAAAGNARICQWRRVNLEVDRVAAADNSLQSELAGDSVRQADLGRLHDAVISLRAARVDRDVERTRAAASKVADLAGDMAK